MIHYPKSFLNKGRIRALWVNLKNSSKLKLLAFWRKYTPFIAQKCTYEKVTKNWGRAPPLIWTKSKRTATFFSWKLPSWTLWPQDNSSRDIICVKCRERSESGDRLWGKGDICLKMKNVWKVSSWSRGGLKAQVSPTIPRQKIYHTL